MKRRNAVRLTLRTIEKAAAKPTSYFIWDLDQVVSVNEVEIRGGVGAAIGQAA